MMYKRAMLFLMITVVAGCVACGKTHHTSQDVDPPFMAELFFKTWKKQDWKALYQITHPSFMQLLRTQRLSPEQQRMSDEELFIHEFRQVQGQNPGLILKSYRIEYVDPYTKGATTLWIYAVVNGKNRKLPMILDNLSYKIDLARVQEFTDLEKPAKQKRK
jgi:hypothetical protein